MAGCQECGRDLARQNRSGYCRDHRTTGARRQRPRSSTIATKKMSRRSLRAGAELYPPMGEQRPLLRGECKGGDRPCPWVACKHHLYLDIDPATGSIKINFPYLEPWELIETCSLDVADRRGLTLHELGDVINLTRERVRQIETKALLELRTLIGEDIE